MKKRLSLFYGKLLIMLLIGTIPIITNAQIYVDIDATTGSNNGTSWASAYTDLQDALDAASASDEIWVAEGTYLPKDAPDGTTSTGLTDRYNTFHLDSDKKIYGGFSGTETMLSQRDHTTNVTILSGDFSGDDVVTGNSISGNTENAYHVIITAHLTTAAIFDGFTVKGGNTYTFSFNINYSGNLYSILQGGGMYNVSSSPSITNTTFIHNQAHSGGGGMLNFSSAPSITNTTFSHNQAGSGGGMANLSSDPSITNTTIIHNNSGYNRGGVFNNSS
ncbi:MAG: hypothetical protein AB8G11_06445, partial [Saprospiraceae bacterium]